MEVACLQPGCKAQPGAAFQQKQCRRGDVHARIPRIQVRATTGLWLSSRRFNPLATTMRTTATSSRRKGVVVMGVEDSYAGALVEIAKSKNLLDEIYDDVGKLFKYIEEPKLSKFLANPVMDAQNKKEVLKSMAKEEKLNQYTLNFLLLLVDKKRTNILKEILEAYEEKYYELNQTEVAVVTSAVKIESNQLSQIAQKVQSLTGAKNVKIKNVVDPSVIAGFSINYGPGGSLFIDLTVKGELDRIAAALEEVPMAPPTPAPAPV